MLGDVPILTVIEIGSPIAQFQPLFQICKGHGLCPAEVFGRAAKPDTMQALDLALVSPHAK